MFLFVPSLLNNPEKGGTTLKLEAAGVSILAQRKDEDEALVKINLREMEIQMRYQEAGQSSLQVCLVKFRGLIREKGHVRSMEVVAPSSGNYWPYLLSIEKASRLLEFNLSFSPLPTGSSRKSHTFGTRINL
jgi:hypothetical protein